MPQPEPGTTELVARGVSDAVAAPVKLAERAVEAVRHPEATARKAVEALEGLSEIVSAFADPAPDVPLNQPIGPHRRYVWARSELATFKRIKDALGGTVNDVVLAVVTGSVRNWLHRRSIRTEGLELRALVPVSIRSEDERGNLGNRIALMRGPLPVYVEDPVRRLRTISEEMAGLKRSKQALGAEVISRFNDFAPPTLLAQASRINFSTRLFNLIVTNVPGPQMPLYVLGRELEEVFPVAFLPQNHALAVAIMSYNGKVGFGLLADYDSMEDVEAVAAGINESLAELERQRAATAGLSARRARPARLEHVPARHPLHRRPDRRALRDHPGRRGDRRAADAGAALRSTRSSARCCCATRAAAPGGASTRRWPQRRFPGKEVADGLLIVVGGTLLLAPGFITDIFGVLLLIPPTRAIARSVLLRASRSAASRWSAWACRGRRAIRPGASGRAGAAAHYDYDATAEEVPPTATARAAAAAATTTSAVKLHDHRPSSQVSINSPRLNRRCVAA